MLHPNELPVVYRSGATPQLLPRQTVLHEAERLGAAYVEAFFTQVHRQCAEPDALQQARHWAATLT